jgi:hypothetical protein
MAINRYSTSSRFNPTTTRPLTKKERIAAAKAENLRREQEYFRSMDERDDMIEGNERLRAQYEGDLAAYEKLKKESPEMLSSSGREYSMMGGKGITLSDEGLKTYQEMERKEGRAIPYKVERAVATTFGDPLETEEDFFNEMKRGRGMAGVQSYFKKPVEPKYKTPSMPEAPTPVTEEMELKGVPRRLRSERREMIGTDSTPYRDPKKPGKGRTFVRRGFKGDKIKYEKGRPNLVERAKIGGDRARYRQEERLAKSTYKEGLEDLSRDELAKRDTRLRQERREFLGSTGRTGLKGLGAAIQTGKDIRNVKRAMKYREELGVSDDTRAISNIRPSQLSKTSKVKYFTPERMENYRSSLDNPLNRNSVGKFFK